MNIGAFDPAGSRLHGTIIASLLASSLIFGDWFIWLCAAAVLWAYLRGWVWVVRQS